MIKHFKSIIDVNMFETIKCYNIYIYIYISNNNTNNYTYCLKNII